MKILKIFMCPKITSEFIYFQIHHNCHQLEVMWEKSKTFPIARVLDISTGSKELVNQLPAYGRAVQREKTSRLQKKPGGDSGLLGGSGKKEDKA